MKEKNIQWWEGWDEESRRRTKQQAERLNFTAQEGSTLDRIWKGTFMNDRHRRRDTPHHVRPWNIPIRVQHPFIWDMRNDKYIGDIKYIQPDGSIIPYTESDFYLKHRRYGYR